MASIPRDGGTKVVSAYVEVVAKHEERNPHEGWRYCTIYCTRWQENTREMDEKVVTEIPDGHTVIVGGKRTRNRIAVKDVRTLPESNLGNTTVRAEHDVQIVSRRSDRDKVRRETTSIEEEISEMSEKDELTKRKGIRRKAETDDEASELQVIKIPVK